MSKNNLKTFCFDLLALFITGSKKAIAKSRAHETAIKRFINRDMLFSVYESVALIIAFVDSFSALKTEFKQLY